MAQFGTELGGGPPGIDPDARGSGLPLRLRGGRDRQRSARRAVLRRHDRELSAESR